MKAAVISALNQLALTDAPDPVPAADEVVVRLRAAALNHRDVWIKLGQYAGLKYPNIPGSDGAGVIEQVGAKVDKDLLGREVIIDPGFNWGDSLKAQGPQFSILGLPRDGTLAEKISVPLMQVSPKPDHLTWEEAAALPLAGLTAWRAVFTRAQLKAGEKILVTGIGGGTALFALQYAVSLGAEVWVTSSSSEKISRAFQLGAKGGSDYAKPGWAAELAKASGGFDVIIDSSGGPGFNDLIELAAPGGRIAFFGATRGNPHELPLRKIFWRQLSLLGSTLGSPADWGAMTHFVQQHKIKPIISDVFRFEQVVDAFALMERGGQFGKIVVGISAS